jgi:hypothetical protein
MKKIPIVVMLIVSIMGAGAFWNEDVDASDSALSKAVFYVD